MQSSNSGPKSIRLTVAQALIRFMAAQEVERDRVRSNFFAGCFGIFGHGNLAGIGQALHQHGDLLAFHQARNEQAMVHIATGYARQRNRLATFACTSSVGPGATNMVTGAALATINRLPVLLLPGDTFATRRPHPVLQQLEAPHDGSLSVNDCFRPVSRYFARVERPEQLIPAALEAMRVLTDPAETGAVTLALPQDVQAEAFDVPSGFLEPRCWKIRRQMPGRDALSELATALRSSSRPLIVAGGGVVYSEAEAALEALVDASGIPVCETQAGRGAMRSDHPLALGAVGATGSAAANHLACEADLVLGIGTRWSDFTTASKTAFQDPAVRFFNINVAAFDAAKHNGVGIVGDARLSLEELRGMIAGRHCRREWERRAIDEANAWRREVQQFVTRKHEPIPSQAEVIGAVNDAAEQRGVVVCAAGSLPGDLHKLWVARSTKTYHVEYGYSCMGYELPGAMGVKLAAPDRDVFAMVGDGSWLMMPGELATAVAERIGIVVVLVDNQGYASIGALSRSLGSEGFGTHYQISINGEPPLDDAHGKGPKTPVSAPAGDLAAVAEGLGAPVVRANDISELRAALQQAKRLSAEGPVVVYVKTDRYAGVPSFESWWDVPVAEVSDQPLVQAARRNYETARQAQRDYLDPQ